jgi:hypothetical protein
MIALYLVTLVLLSLSLATNRPKTIKALKTGATMFLNLLPPFLSVLMLVALALTALGPEIIRDWLGSGSGWMAYVIAALVGAVALIPDPRLSVVRDAGR